MKRNNHVAKYGWFKIRKDILIKPGFTLIESMITLMIMMILLSLFQMIYVIGNQYQEKIKDVSLLQWWIATTQIENGVRNETYIKCKQNGKYSGIYFKDKKNRMMVYRFYKNQFIQSRYLSGRFYGYVPYLFSIQEGEFYEENHRLYLRAIFDNGKSYQTSFELWKDERE